MRRNTEVMGWGSWVAIGVAAIVLLGAVSLTVYGGRATPAQHPVELIIPNDRLPN